MHVHGIQKLTIQKFGVMLVLPQSYLSPDSARPRLAVLVPDAHGMLYTFDFLKGAVVPVDRADSELNAHDSVLLWARARNLVRLIPALSPRLQSAVLADYGEAELPLTGPVADRIRSIQDGVLLQAVLSDRSWYLTALSGYGRISTAAPRIECDDPVIGVFREGRDNQRLGLFTRRGDEIEQRRPWMAPVVVARVDGLDHVATGGREVPLVATSDHDGFVKVTSIPGQMLLQFDPRRDW